MGHSFLQTVEERSSGRLLAIGCFEHSLATRSFPLPHLVAAKTIHSYRTGLLLDDQRADEVLDHWLNDLHSQPNCHGVEFPSIRLASDLAKRLQAAVDRHQLTWQVPEQWNSAALFSPAVEFENLYGHLSNDRQKALRKKATHLGKSGLVRLRQIDCGSPLGNSVEKFLELEHASWKGQFGTSLLSTDSGIRFVHCMANSFQQQTQLVLTQLQVGSETAATAISLIDGTTMFTFKLGWHPKFSKASPGVLHMHLLLPFVHEHFPNITCLDSCARPNSFFESLWPHQIPVGNAIIATSSLAQGIVASMSVAKKVFGHFSQSLSS